MPSSFADHLRAARHGYFVGREDERVLFRAVLEAEELPFHVLYVHGPGGVGKTALLREFLHLCEETDMPAHYLDARDVEPTAAAFMQAVQEGAGSTWLDGTFHEERFVLMIDTFETLAPLERWLREDFLPPLPAHVLVVLSGRDPLPVAWRADVGMKALVHPLALRNLGPKESRRYLARRGIPEAQHDRIVSFAHGHPLALSLVADAFDQQSGQEVAPVESPDLVGTLVKRFVHEVPSPRHRTTLQACALVHALTEPLLARLLDAEDVRALFDWLHTLSFIEAGRKGLFPHDLAREVLAADLRWRDAETYDLLRRRARRYYTEQMRRGRPPEEALTDYMVLYREHPVVRPYFQRLQAQWEGHAPLIRDRVRDEDWPHLRRMTARHEGEAAAALLDYWKERQPERVQVFRNTEEEAPAGFIFPLALGETTDADREKDPCVQTAWHYLETHAPLRAGERATVFRFWIDREQHQALSPVQSLIAAYRVRHYLTTSNLAFTFTPSAHPEQWALIFAYADLQRLPDADFEVDGRTYGFFGHDWRTVPPPTWLDLLAEREVTVGEPEAVPRPSGATTLVLSRPDFTEAVKEALQHYARPDALHGNPLLRSRLVLAETGAEAAMEARLHRLRTLLREAAEALEADARTAKFYRALDATYLDPAPTQEKASERLDVPFSTFRRHLGRGLEHVTEALWQQETGNALARS